MRCASGAREAVAGLRAEARSNLGSKTPGPPRVCPQTHAGGRGSPRPGTLAPGLSDPRDALAQMSAEATFLWAQKWRQRDHEFQKYKQ